MAGNVYALIRVSTKQQNEARQVIEMEKLGIIKNNVVIEKESGKSTARTKYHRLVKRLKAGDILYIESVDRLARDYDTILDQWYILTKQKGVIIRVIDTPMLDTDKADNNLSSKFMKDIMLITKAYEAESVWQKIKDNQAKGIAVAKAKGKPFGRTKQKVTDEEIKIVKQYQNKEISLDTALKLSKRKRAAFYNLRNKVIKL